MHVHALAVMCALYVQIYAVGDACMYVCVCGRVCIGVCVCVYADMHGMISPEFAHWLKHTDAGRTANTQATPDNTLFIVSPDAPSLTLTPPVKEGGDSGAVPVGSVVAPSDDKGWSWYDVMVSTHTHTHTHTH